MCGALEIVDNSFYQKNSWYCIHVGEEAEEKWA